MCGIVGLFGYTKQPPFSEKWTELVNHLQHRGPDEGAWWADGPFFFGHRRLAIIDLQSGGQPMASADGRFVITFNGEIYNYIELREELQKLGCSFETTSDTEVLLQGYTRWGESLLERLIGQFAFAIADRHKKELFLARDRFGEKPLFYWQAEGFFAFASEVRPLAAIPSFKPEIDLQALGGYLCLNYVPGDATLLAPIRRLAPAHWMLVKENGALLTGKYFDLDLFEEHEHVKAPLQKLVVEFQQKLDRAVALCLRSDVPVGIFLSGGVDSSLVAESAMRQGKLSDAYFIDFKEQTYSESNNAQAVASHLGLPLRKAILEPPDFDTFIRFAQHADDPLADSSGVAVWRISAMAAKANKVVLGGDGGDEFFGGYITYQATMLYRRLHAILPSALRHHLSLFGSHIPTTEGKASFSYRVWRFLRAFNLLPGVAHFTWNATWLPSETVQFLSPDYRPRAEEVQSALLQLADGLGLNSGEITLQKLQRADILDYLPNDILAKVDRMSMAHGLEVRAPFLNPEVAQFGLQLPARYKVSSVMGSPKLLPRMLMEKIYGKKIAFSPKKGFSIPVHRWIRGPLRETFQSLLSPASINTIDFLNADAVNRALTLHLAGQRTYGFELWGLAILVAWFESRVANSIAQTPIREQLKRREI